MQLTYALEIAKDSLSIFVIIPMFIMGVYFSVKLGWPQFTKIPVAWNSLLKKHESKSGNFSSFSALAAVLGGNLGTGNIAGVAVALHFGGPGVLFWMWVMAIFGSIIKFIGTYIGVKYRQQDGPGSYKGGPMYYLAYGLKMPKLAILYSIFMIIAAFLVGNLVQVNSLVLPVSQLDINPLWAGILLAAFTAWVIAGDSKIFVNLVSAVVPFMAFIYLFACIWILSINTSEILPALKLILTSAFNFKAATSGAVSYGILAAMQSGFDRGLFATDAGVGIAPVLHSKIPIPESRLDEGAFEQGMVSIIAPMVVMFICTVTGLVLLVTNAWVDPCVQSTNVCIKAFNLGSGTSYAGLLVVITLLLFAFTTILTWFFCANSAMDFIMGTGAKATYVKRLVFVAFILLIPLGSIVHPTLIWPLADISLNCMLLINLFAISALFPKVEKSLRKK